jgi:hypothetical protein
MKKTIDTFNTLSEIEIDFQDFYSIRIIENRIYLMGFISRDLIRRLKEQDFELTFDDKNLWFNLIGKLNDVSIEVTLTIK